MCLRLLTVFFLLAVNLANCVEWVWSLLSLGSFWCWVLMLHGHINCAKLFLEVVCSSNVFLWFDEFRVF